MHGVTHSCPHTFRLPKGAGGVRGRLEGRAGGGQEGAGGLVAGRVGAWGTGVTSPPCADLHTHGPEQDTLPDAQWPPGRNTWVLLSQRSQKPHGPGPGPGPSCVGLRSFLTRMGESGETGGSEPGEK